MSKKKEATKPVKANDKTHLIELLDRMHGAGTVMVGNRTIVNVKIFPTNIPSIDLAFGCGGIPQGRIIEIYGHESSGKTTACLEFIEACQNHYFEDKDRYGEVAFIDAEHAFDPEWAKNIGVKLDKLLLSQPNSGDEAFSIIETMVNSKLIDLIVVDSVAALVPQVELNGDISDSNIGAQARMMSAGLRRLRGIVNTSKTTIIFINQIREKIGVMFGNPETTPGGKALKFYSSIRAEVRRGATIKEGDDTVGFRTSMKIVKNKVAPPFTRAEFDICFGLPKRPTYGIDSTASLLETAVDNKIVTRSSSWYSYENTKIGNGTANAVSFLNENPAIYNEIRDKTYNVVFDFRDKCHIVQDIGVPDISDDDILDDDSDETLND